MCHKPQNPSENTCPYRQMESFSQLPPYVQETLLQCGPKGLDDEQIKQCSQYMTERA